MTNNAAATNVNLYKMTIDGVGSKAKSFGERASRRTRAGSRPDEGPSSVGIRKFSVEAGSAHGKKLAVCRRGGDLERVLNERP